MRVKLKIIELKKDGWSNKRIANELGCSPSTVTYHCNGAYRTRHIKRKTERCRSHKAQAVALLGGKCRVCSYKRCVDCLDFHHVNGEKQDRFIRHSITKFSLARLMKELKKCVLVCCRCHREIHAGITPCPKLEPPVGRVSIPLHKLHRLGC